jgi:hypothetical protein
VLGFDDLPTHWKRRRLPAKKAQDTLDELVALRHDIAHRGAAANYVQKWRVVGAFDHIKELVGFTDSATNLFLGRHLGRLPF